MALETYNKKRNFRQTPEPRGKVIKGRSHRFVVQEHHASRLHFDFRLEMAGVLKSWAVPKGPSMNPRDKRLAVEVEDHPVDYINFEGTIEEGNYGAGEVVVWDTGTYETDEDVAPEEAIEGGKITFDLNGDKLRGQFSLIKMHGRDRQWLLIKGSDEFADEEWDLDLELNIAEGASKKKERKRTAGRRQRRPIARRAARAGVPEETERPGREEPFPRIPGSKAMPMPKEIEPMLATLVDEPFDHPEWIFETKWDGVRALCYIKNGKATLISRNDNDITYRYPELKTIAELVDAKEAILDGEIVVMNEQGVSSFQLLQQRLGLQNKKEIAEMVKKYPVIFNVFDLIYYDGFNLMKGELIRRKELLKEILTDSDAVRYTQHREENGKETFQQAQKQGLEGIIAKHKRSSYIQGRSGRWLKIKTVQRQEVVIAGYTQPRRSREHLGALVVGLYTDEGKLRYVGHVGGGFNRQSLKLVFDAMQPFRTKKSPFEEPPRTNEPVQWVEPRLVGEVKFGEWTSEYHMRQPIFMGLRDDKDPRECTFEFRQAAEEKVEEIEEKLSSNGSGDATPRAKRRVPAKAPLAFPQFTKAENLSGDIDLEIEGKIVPLTHLDKAYWPEEGYTKGDLLQYYARIGKYILPYLEDRPLILRRYPNGIEGQSFYQHDVNQVPEYVKTVQLKMEGGRKIDYVVCNNLATLMYVVNLGTIAQNAWHSRTESLDHPDWIVFDLDPTTDDYGVVADVALALKGVLDRLGLASYPKTSGSRGMHVFVPIEKGYSFNETARIAQQVAGIVARENPRIATVERSISKRKKGLVYVDHLQNAWGKTIVSPYSVRAKPGATVSTPLSWKEVGHKLDLKRFTIKTMVTRLKEKKDLFKDALQQPQRLEEAMQRLDAILHPPRSRRRTTPQRKQRIHAKH